MIYTISVSSNATAGKQVRSGTGEVHEYDAGSRILTSNYVSVDLRNLLPDGTTPRSMCILKACSFVCHDVRDTYPVDPETGNPIPQIGSIRLMNVSCPNQRTNDQKAGAVVGHLFAVPGVPPSATTDSWQWRLSNPFRVFCNQVPEQLEFQITGPATTAVFAFTMELEVDDDELL